MLVGLQEVGELFLERVDEGVVGAVEEEGLYLHKMMMKMMRIAKELVNRIKRMLIYVKREEVNYWCGGLLGCLSQH